jgi:hypothetical protein
MWKKMSIFWELPYWKILEVHSAIDVMHVTKNLGNGSAQRRRVLQRKTGRKQIWRALAGSTTGSNEYILAELSWSRQCSDSSRTP